MTAYLPNKDGEVTRCQAHDPNHCPYHVSGDGSPLQHYATREEAMAAFENHMKGNATSVKGLSKNKQSMTDTNANDDLKPTGLLDGKYIQSSRCTEYNRNLKSLLEQDAVESINPGVIDSDKDSKAIYDDLKKDFVNLNKEMEDLHEYDNYTYNDIADDIKRNIADRHSKEVDGLINNLTDKLGDPSFQKEIQERSALYSKMAMGKNNAEGVRMLEGDTIVLKDFLPAGAKANSPEDDEAFSRPLKVTSAKVSRILHMAELTLQDENGKEHQATLLASDINTSKVYSNKLQRLENISNRMKNGIPDSSDNYESKARGTNNAIDCYNSLVDTLKLDEPKFNTVNPAIEYDEADIKRQVLEDPRYMNARDEMLKRYDKRQMKNDAIGGMIFLNAASKMKPASPEKKKAYEARHPNYRFLAESSDGVNCVEYLGDHQRMLVRDNRVDPITISVRNGRHKVVTTVQLNSKYLS